MTTLEARRIERGKALIVIPSITPSNNELIRMHHFARGRLKDNLIKQLAVAINNSGLQVTQMTAPGKRAVKITSYRKGVLDKDNLVGGMKVLIDAIKDIGLLWDDSPEHMVLIPRQHKDKKTRTEIYIEEMES